MAIGIPVEYPGYVRSTRVNPNAEWADQGMMGPRPVVVAPPLPYNPGTGMNPYELGPIQDEPPGPPLEFTPAPPARPPHVPHPGYSPDMYGPAPTPSPSAGGDIGPGIPLAPSEPVTSFDLPAQANPPFAAPGGMGGYNPRAVYSALTAPGPPPSRRYSSTRPEFIFTNPAAAQQAAANYAARLQYEAGQDQGYQRYQGQLAAEQEATQRAAQATEAARANEATRLAAISKEGEATRASNERIAGMSALMAQYQRAEQDWLQNERNRATAESLARQKNANPDAKIDPRYITLGPDGKTWVASPAFNPRPRPRPPTFAGGAMAMGVPEETPATPQPTEPTPQTAQAAPAVPAAPPEYNMAEGAGVSGWKAYTPGGALWNAGVKIWPYTPTGYVLNRIVGAFRPATPPPAPAVPAQ